MRRTASSIAILSAILAMGVAPADRATAPGQTTSVRIRDMQFQPSSVRVKVGDSVTWTNGDDRDHNISAADKTFDSGNLKQSASYTYRFTKAGSFDYTCSYHPRMRGSVQVDN